MAKRKIRGWWVMAQGPNGEFGFCTRCKGTMPALKFPMNLKAACMYMKAFVEEHIYCKDTGESTGRVTR